VSIRQLLAVAGILVAALAALWYAGLGQRGGGGSDNGVQVVLSATATGSGAWQRYLLTVKNVADGDFTGQALLIDAQDAGQPSSTQLPTRVPNASSRLPVAEVAGQSAYQVQVSVHSRTSRTVTIIAPDHFNYAQLRVGDQVLADSPVDRAPRLSVAVLSDVESAATTIAQLRLDRYTPHVVQLASAGELPNGTTLLAGYAAIVIDQFDTETLSGAQVQALRDFVGLGGTLVVVGGSDWRQSLAPLPADLLPMRPTSTASLSLAPVAQLAGTTAGDLVAPAAVGALTKGAQTLVAAAGGGALAAVLGYGSGEVVQLAYDPGADPVRGTPYERLGWTQALGPAFGQRASGAVTGAWLPVPESSFTALLPTADDAPLPSPAILGTILLLYLLAVGPLNYLVVRRRIGRPTLFWFTTPLVSVVFAALFYLSGSVLQGTLQDHEVQVIKVGPQGAASVVQYHRVLFLRRGNHEIAPDQNSLVAPLTLDTFRVTGSTCERCTNQLQGLPSGAERVLPGPAPLVEESGVVYGSVRVVASTTATHLPDGVSAHLRVSGGRLRGTVTNLGRQPVGDLELFAYDGQSYYRAPVSGFLDAGRSATVDGGVSVVPSGGNGAQQPPAAAPGSVASLLQAVAASELAEQGDAVLVGLTKPVPSRLTVDGQSPPGLAVAVLQQPVQIEAADSDLQGFEQKRLISSSGDPSSGFTDVYDLTVPSASVPLELNFGAESVTRLEIYDWSQGTFVPVAADTPALNASTPLTAGEVHDGLVRVRVREPRLLWAQAIWVDTAS
jgi:hypothetical protein